MHLGNVCLRRCNHDLLLTFNRPPHHPQIQHHTCTTQQGFIPTFQISLCLRRTSKATLSERKNAKGVHVSFFILISSARVHTPAHIRIQMAAMNLHCIYRCGKRPSYKLLLMMPLYCKGSDYAGEMFREREQAQGHSTRVWILRKPLKVPTAPWFIRPFPAYVCMMSYRPV